MPVSTPDRLGDYTRQWAELGITAWDGPWWEAVGQFGDAVARILGAASSTVVPCNNVTMGFATVASCLTYTPQRPRIVLCDLEFTTTLPFWSAQQDYGAEIHLVRSEDGVSVDPARMEQAIDERTALVVTSHAYFRSGALQDIERLQRRAREHGALLVVDCYQSAGCVPLDASSFDFVVGGCHKWLCGGPGGGWLYVRPDLIESLRPRLCGWFSLSEPFAYEKAANPRFHSGVNRFLNGTPNVLALYAASAGLEWVERIGLPAIRRHSQQLTGWLLEEVKRRGLTVRTPHSPEARNGMLCIDFPEARAAQAALEQAGCILDYRPDCGIRVSPHFYNQQSDLEQFLTELDSYLRG